MNQTGYTLAISTKASGIVDPIDNTVYGTISGIKKTIEHLDHITVTLRERLAPILAPVSPLTASEAKACSRPSVCDLDAELVFIKERVESLIDINNDIIKAVRL